jgi:hypothetical protein
MFEQANLSDRRSVLVDWALRGGIGIASRAALLRSREAQKQQAQYDLARVRAGRMKLKRLELA